MSAISEAFIIIFLLAVTFEGVILRSFDSQKNIELLKRQKRITNGEKAKNGKIKASDEASEYITLKFC